MCWKRSTEYPTQSQTQKEDDIVFDYFGRLVCFLLSLDLLSQKKILENVITIDQCPWNLFDVFIGI